MELFEYIRVLTRRWWLIALLIVVGVSSSVFFSLRQPARYRTTTVLLLNPAAQSELLTPGGISAAAAGAPQLLGADRLARSYDQYLKTNAFTTKAVEQLGLQGVISPGALAGAISTGLVPSTNFWNLTITWGNRQQAQMLANGIARVFIEENRKLQMASRPADSATVSLSDSLSYYEKRVNSLRLERESLENSGRLTDKDRLSDVESRLMAAEDTYVKLLANASQSQAAEEARMNTATVVDEAPLPGRPINDTVQLNAIMAGVAALAIGVGLVILLDYMDDTVKAPEDLERLSGQSLLGVIAALPGTYGQQPRRFRRLRRAMGKKTEPKPGEVAPVVITSHEPLHSIAEAFRTLRTNIEFSTISAERRSERGEASEAPERTLFGARRLLASVLEVPLEKRARTLVVTSSMPAEGKSTIAANLAVVFAQTGKRVLLIDADLRSPSVHGLFGLTSDTGFTSLLLSGSDLPAAGGPQVAPYTPIESVPTLHVLPCGPLPPNPSELLSSARAAEVIAGLATHYDLIIFDSPPNLVTDAAVLASRCDGVIVVAWAGITRRGALANCLQTLNKVGAQPLGIVLNKVRPQSLSRYGGYYRYYRYGYGYQNGHSSNGRNGRNGSANGAQHGVNGVNGALPATTGVEVPPVAPAAPN